MRLLNGDCLELMKDIPDQSIDLILCDLPYGTTRNKWDCIIPLDALWREYKRISKGAIVLTAAQPFTSVLVASNLEMFKCDWVWKKSKATGHLNAKKQPLRDKEDILVFYSKPPTYNPQMIEGTPYKAKAGKPDQCTSQTTSYGAFDNTRNDNPGLRYPKQVLEFNSVQRGSLHPTQKPLSLMEYFINTYTNPGDLVLDNCMGSGTTGVACLNTGRRFIGIELNKDYFEIASKRIQDVAELHGLSKP